MKKKVIILISLFMLNSCGIEFLLTGENSITLINKTEETVRLYWIENTYDLNSNPIQIEHELGEVPANSKKKFTFTDRDCDHPFKAISYSGKKWSKVLASCSGATWTLLP